MSQAVETYLDHVMVYANDPQREVELRAELNDHLEQKIAELEEQGIAREDAIFQALEAHGHPRVVGYRLRGWRWLDVRSQGTARGFIAVGPRAVGVFAFGGASCGVFSIGGFSTGLISMGGFALSLLVAWGGFVVSLGLAYGGCALGLLAIGGAACGIVAWGGTAAGLLANGGVMQSVYTTDTAPPWIVSLAEMIPTQSNEYATLNMIVIVLFVMILAAVMTAQLRERRRIIRADPRLVE